MASRGSKDRRRASRAGIQQEYADRQARIAEDEARLKYIKEHEPERLEAIARMAKALNITLPE